MPELYSINDDKNSKRANIVISFPFDNTVLVVLCGLSYLILIATL